MEIYYSQHGEDFLINRIFSGKTDGYFVEIGCLDGIEFSNTYFFERKGWQGACVEAHHDFIPALRRNRPQSTIVHCAVGEADKENVTFYANKIGSLSTLDKGEETRWKENFKEYFHGFEEQKVAMRTLTSIFDELKPKQIDFVSLDIEGYEVQALHGLDFSKYRPEIFIIEYKDEKHKNEIEAILLPNAYKFISRIGCNMFFSLNENHGDIINGRYDTVRLLQIEMDGKRHWHEATQLNPSVARRIKLLLKRTPVGAAWRYIYQFNQRLVQWWKVTSYKKKRRILDKYRKKYELGIFVETGTFLGETVEFFKKKFDSVYSIELSKELFEDAKKKFEADKNVSILSGDSGSVLAQLVPTLSQPALFWLDGHYSYQFYEGDRYIRTALGEKNTPIVSELEVLLSDSKLHVILIDDARLFTGENDYPKIEAIQQMVERSAKPYRLFLANDIIHLIPSQ